MAYDHELADRIRELVADEEGVTEQRMFGGLAFLIKHVRPMVMRGWLRVEAVELALSSQLETWVARGVSYARPLPAKTRRR